MSPFQLYIGVIRESKLKGSKDTLSTADVTYWLNKALNEFVDSKYEEFEANEEAKRSLDSLISTITVTSPSTTSLNTTTLNTFVLPDTDTRFIVSERVTMTVGTTSTVVTIKPITTDELNIEMTDPFSTYKLHLGKAKPLRYNANNDVVVVAENTYTVSNYTCIRIENPTLFTIASATDTSEYTVIPSKSHSELITIAVRQILENESNPRYQTYNIEEIKSKS